MPRKKRGKPEKKKRPGNAFYYLTCFCSGATILMLEVLGFRLFAPFFGNSVYISGTLIGVILFALSAGYYLGGLLADRKPQPKVMYGLIFWAAAYLVPVYLFYEPVLQFFQKWGLIGGTISATIVIYAVPMTLLSMVSPYLIKLMADAESLGRSAGSIFAVSTVGSILGTFSTTFILIPVWGSNRTLALCLAILIAISVAGLVMVKTRYLGAGLVALPLLLPHYSLAEPNLLHEQESFYNLIRVYETDEERSLVLNSSQWLQSYRPDVTDLTHTYREYFNLGPYLTKVDSALVLGMSAGASVLELKHFFDFPIDAVEIDPEVVDVAKKYFGVSEDDKLTIHVEDAKSFVARSAKQYDLIEIDLFQGGPDIPFYIATKEFFEQVRDCLSPNGVVMVNVLGTIDDSDKNDLIRAMANTYAAVFPSVFLFQIPEEISDNAILLAFKKPKKLSDLKERLGQVDHEVISILGELMGKRLRQYRPEPDGVVFTDDHAPIEPMTHALAAH